jgi:hypothetical protein
MGFNAERQRFTSEQEIAPRGQVRPIIADLSELGVYYSFSQGLYEDFNTPPKRWVEGRTEVLTDYHVIELGNDDPEAYMRIFKVRKGLIADLSHLEIYDWRQFLHKRQRRPFPEDEALRTRKSIPLPVIWTAFNKAELGLVKPAIQKELGVKLKHFKLQPLLDVITGVEDEGDEVWEEEVEGSEDDS